MTNKSRPAIAISNSDTKTFNCKRRFYYAYGLGVIPKAKGTALSKGTYGHKLLECWYRDQSLTALQDFHTLELTKLDMFENPDFAAKDMATTYFLVMDYINYYYEGDKARIPKIHYIEQEFELNLTPYLPTRFENQLEKMVFRFKPDIIWEDPDTHKLVVVDHKFVYDFYKPTQIALDAQMPKYVTALTALDIDVHFAILNQVRTRSMKSVQGIDRFNREVIIPNRAQYETMWIDHMTTAKEMADWFSLTPDEKAQTEHSPRIYNTMVCRLCNYSELCVAELKGHDQEVIDLMNTSMEPYNYGVRTIEALSAVESNGS